MNIEQFFREARVWSAVTSSNLHSVAYWRPGKVLGVRFKDKKNSGAGSEYWYYAVPEFVYHLLRDAGSKGKFLWQTIRDRYAFRQVI